MSRWEWYREGRVPLHTLRADMTTALQKQYENGKIGYAYGYSRVKFLPDEAVAAKRQV